MSYREELILEIETVKDIIGMAEHSSKKTMQPIKGSTESTVGK